VPAPANNSGLRPAVTAAGNDKSSNPPGMGKLSFYRTSGQLGTYSSSSEFNLQVAESRPKPKLEL